MLWATWEGASLCTWLGWQNIRQKTFVALSCTPSAAERMMFRSTLKYTYPAIRYVDCRNWATFALGALSELDSPAIREALAARLADADDEVRGEAIGGLAKRQDERAVDAILGELGKPDVMAQR